MHIRNLTPEDAGAYQALRLHGLNEFPTAFASSFEEEVGTPLEEIARRLQPQASGAIFGAFDEDALVGLVGVQRESMRKLSHKAFVWGMYTRPTHRRRGVASRLLEHALAYAWQSLQVSQLNLGVNTANASAIALYRGFGFDVWGTEKAAMRVGSTLCDEHHMVCRKHGAA